MALKVLRLPVEAVLAYAAGRVPTLAERTVDNDVYLTTDRNGNVSWGITFVPTRRMLDFIDVASGDDHACALSYSGICVCIGDNTYGQSAIPGDASARYKSIAAGRTVSCAVTRGSGQLVCWGSGPAAAPPAHVLAQSFVTASCAGDTCCGITPQQQSVCWGDVPIHVDPGAAEGWAPPSRVTGANNTYVWVAPGPGFACALDNTRATTCWGSKAPSIGATGALGELASHSFSYVHPYMTLSGSAATFVQRVDRVCGIGLQDATLQCWLRYDALPSDATPVDVQRDSSPDRGDAVFPAGMVSSVHISPDIACVTIFSTVPGEYIPACWGSYTANVIPANFQGTFSRLYTAFDVLGLRSNGRMQPFTTGSISVDAKAAWRFSDLYMGIYTNVVCGVLSAPTAGEVVCAGAATASVLNGPPNTERYTAVAVTPLAGCGIRTVTSLVSCWGVESPDPPAVPLQRLTAGGANWFCGLTLANASVVCFGQPTMALQINVIPSSAVAVAELRGMHGYPCVVRTDSWAVCWGLSMIPEQAREISARPLLSVSIDITVGCIVGLDGNVRCWGNDPLVGFDIDDTPQAFIPSVSFPGSDCVCSSTAALMAFCYTARQRLSINAVATMHLFHKGVCAHVTSSNSVQCHRIESGHFSATALPGVPSAVASLAISHNARCWSDVPTLQVQCVDRAGNVLTLPGSVANYAFSMLTAGTGHVCGIRDTGVAVCWGDGAFGQLTTPAGSFSALSAGTHHTCGRFVNGSIACWGMNMHASPATASLITARWDKVVSGCAVACAQRYNAGTGLFTAMCWDALGVLWSDAWQVPAPATVSLDVRVCARPILAVVDNFGLNHRSVLLGRDTCSNCSVLTSMQRWQPFDADAAVATWSMLSVGPEVLSVRVIDSNATWEITFAAFEGMHVGIRSVNLSAAVPARIAAGAFAHVGATTVERLWLPERRAIELSPGALTGLQSLRSLNSPVTGRADLTRVEAFTLRSTAFSLDVLSDVGTLVVDLPVGVRELLPMAGVVPFVTTLRLPQLTPYESIVVPSGSMRGMMALQQLHASSSNLRTWANGTLALSALAGSPVLRYIDATGCNISALDLDAPLPALAQFVICPGNPAAANILHDPLLFAACPSLRSLDSTWDPDTLQATRCGIESIHPDILRFAPAVLHVNLSDNSITILQTVRVAVSSVFAPLDGRQRRLLLLRNRIDTITANDVDRGFPGLTDLDLTSNNISVIDDDAFTNENNLVLANVILRDNPVLSMPCRAGWVKVTVVLAGGATYPACRRCAPGYFCPGDGLQLPCPTGRFNDLERGTSTASCTACSRGRYNGLKGQTSLACSLCPVGTASNTTGAVNVSSCVECPPGFIGFVPGLAACSACPAGTYQPSIGAFDTAQCIRCPRGKYSSSTAATNDTVCTSCLAGLETVTDGAQSEQACIPAACPSGSVRSTAGDCIQCAAGTYASAGVCADCPRGTYAASPSSSACQACPEGTFGTVVRATSSLSCRGCPVGTVCRSDRAGCDAFCPAGTVPSGPVLNAPTCSRPVDVACTPCANSSTSMCFAGLLVQTPTLRYLHNVEQGATLAVFANLNDDASSCMERLRSSLQEEPAFRYGYVRNVILIATCVGVLAFPMLVGVIALRKRKSVRDASQLLALDIFATAHPVPRLQPVRNAPNRVGGLFSVAFIVAAIGVSLGVLARLWTNTYSVVTSVVNTPQLTTDSWLSDVHYGTLSVRLFSVGPSGVPCSAPTLTAATSEWTMESTEPVLLDAATASQLRIGPTAATRLQSTAGCLTTFSCRDCQMTAARTVSVQVPGSHQSMILSFDARQASSSCAITASVLASAPAASTPLAAVDVDIIVMPVSVSYSGTQGGVASGSGYDLIVASKRSAANLNPEVLQPGADTVTITLQFQPTTYTSLIQVTDSVDALQTFFTIVGFISGLAGGIKQLMSWSERAADGAAKVSSHGLLKRALSHSSSAMAAIKYFTLRTAKAASSSAGPTHDTAATIQLASSPLAPTSPPASATRNDGDPSSRRWSALRARSWVKRADKQSPAPAATVAARRTFSPLASNSVTTSAVLDSQSEPVVITNPVLVAQQEAGVKV